MQILFTTSNTSGSRWIRDITGEPVSHTAIRCGNLVLHADWDGVDLVPYAEFALKHKIVLRIPHKIGVRKFWAAWVKYRGKPYDYTALLFLAVVFALRKIGINIKKNLWSISGSYICTEFVSSVIIGKEDSMITPYQLYLKLSKDNR